MRSLTDIPVDAISSHIPVESEPAPSALYSFKGGDPLRQELVGCRQIGNIRTDTSHGALHSGQRILD